MIKQNTGGHWILTWYCNIKHKLNYPKNEQNMLLRCFSKSLVSLRLHITFSQSNKMLYNKLIFRLFWFTKNCSVKRSRSTITMSQKIISWEIHLNNNLVWINTKLLINSNCSTQQQIYCWQLLLKQLLLGLLVSWWWTAIWLRIITHGFNVHTKNKLKPWDPLVTVTMPSELTPYYEIYDSDGN